MKDITLNSIITDKASQLASFLIEKNAQYGDATTKVANILSILYPNGIQPDQYMEVLVVVRMLDKFCRIATNHKDNKEDAWADLSGYSLLQVAKRALHDKKDLHK